MYSGDVSFSVASHAQWVPGLESQADWQRWIRHDRQAAGSGEPAVKAMPPMLRRRTSPVGKLALEAAYGAFNAASLGTGARQVGDASDSTTDSAGLDIPVVFASRHGECARSVELQMALAAAAPMSPTAFSLSVHNANAGLFSIARGSQANTVAIAAGQSTVEHAVIEACGLLADGMRQVLLVVADAPLPALFTDFADEHEEPCGWSWLMQAADENAALPTLSLQWQQVQAASHTMPCAQGTAGPAAVLRFFLDAAASTLQRQADGRHWHWMRHA
ncbi:beta-ketoacyl synthase chain length factor [Herbaspirillum sp. GW103]|uniref:beta-ketoacyl synthase chain length factor n=1 Tax=Herbaspirillum sp. GW103 TaxID=1175306 RepID=UPI0009D9D7F1|nr:beta-ketoacyl synthase chain length factor [Herbaspirillum sp. GW103]